MITKRDEGYAWAVAALALAGSWLAIEVAFPELPASGIPTAFTRGALHAIVFIGLWLGLERTDWSPRVRLGVWLAILAPYTVWLVAIWIFAASGGFHPIHNRHLPLLPLAIFVPLGIGATFVTRSQRFAQVLDAMPAAWPIGLQLYRILGVTFLASWIRGTIPGAFALPAGIGDVVVGALAIPAAIQAASGTPLGRSRALAWNFLGLADLGVAVTMGILTFPTKLQLFGLDRPNAQLGAYPMVMIPAFAVPSALITHLLSIRQLRRRGAARSGASESIAAAAV